MKGIAVFLVILFILATMIGCTRPSPPVVPSSVEPPAQTEDNSSSENQTDRPISPCLISLGHTPDGKFLVYTLGHKFTPPGRQSKNEPLDYDFPLYLTKSEQGGSEQILAVVSDPGLQKIGAEWQSDIISDPDHEGYLLRVKLIRVEKQYEYQIELHTSGDNGQSWQGRDFAWPFN